MSGFEPGPPANAQPAPAQSSKPWKKNRRRTDDNRCRACLQEGHWQRDIQCPLRNRSSATADESVQPAAVRGVLSDWPNSETYLDIEVRGIKAQALIDSGCDKSVAPLSMVSQATLRPTKMELFAANGSRINVVSATMLNFVVQGMPLWVEVLASPDIAECMLG